MEEFWPHTRNFPKPPNMTNDWPNKFDDGHGHSWSTLWLERNGSPICIKCGISNIEYIKILDLQGMKVTRVRALTEE